MKSIKGGGAGATASLTTHSSLTGSVVPRPKFWLYNITKSRLDLDEKYYGRKGLGNSPPHNTFQPHRQCCPKSEISAL